MGNTKSIPILTENEYALSDLVVRVKGGKAALKKTVRDKTRIRVTLRFVPRKMTKKLSDYFTGRKFVEELNEVILRREEGVAEEYSLRVPKETLDDLSWSVDKNSVLAKSKDMMNAVSFDVVCGCKHDHLFPHAVAYVAGGIAWHVKGGSIPVYGPSSDGIEVVGMDFEL